MTTETAYSQQRTHSEKAPTNESYIRTFEKSHVLTHDKNYVVYQAYPQAVIEVYNSGDIFEEWRGTCQST